MPRYLQAGKSQVSYGIEGTPYTEAADLTKYFGLVSDDVELPNPNPYKRHPHTGRKPYTRSPDEKTLEFSVSGLLLDGNTPFQCALGKLTQTSVDPNGNPGSGDEYTKFLFEYDDELPTITVRRQQIDAGTGLNERFIGCKAGLDLSWAMGEPLKWTFNFMAASHAYSEGVGALVNLGVPTTRVPLRAWHQGDILLKNPSGGATLATLATVKGGQVTVNPGLASNHHGKGRYAYSVSEDGEPGELYTSKLTVIPTDLTLWKRARDDDIAVDVEVPFDTGVTFPANNHFRHGALLRFKDAKIVEASMPRKVAGKIEHDVVFDPNNVEIEVHVPSP